MSFGGESLGIALSGLVMIAFGLALRRYRDAVHERMDDQHSVFGAWLGERGQMKSNPRMWGSVGILWVMFGVLFLVLSPVASQL
jgi:hypothetical protein